VRFPVPLFGVFPSRLSLAYDRPYARFYGLAYQYGKDISNPISYVALGDG
jgi:hypothetical protein